MSKEKEVATTNGTEVTKTGLFSGGDSGFEGTDSQTFKTPFLRILQAVSPELKKSDAKFIEGASAGNFCNSATQGVFDSVDIIVLKVEHSLVVWKPERGGFVGRHPKSMEEKIVARKDGVQKWDQEGNEVMDTIEFYCINADDPSDIFIFPLSKASLKHAKSFATRMRLLKSDGKPVGVSWAGVWNIKVVEESNDKGSWYTIGSRPSFVRFINMEEKTDFIEPAKEMLKSAETDYSVIDASEDSTEPTEF